LAAFVLFLKCYVACWHLADFARCLLRVRFRRHSGHEAERADGPLMTYFRHPRVPVVAVQTAHGPHSVDRMSYAVIGKGWLGRD
jgi:hypothetical protein